MHVFEGEGIFESPFLALSLSLSPLFPLCPLSLSLLVSSLSLCVIPIRRVPRPKFLISRGEQQGRARVTSKFTNRGHERVKN